jgi:hypothetical protein
MPPSENTKEWLDNGELRSKSKHNPTDETTLARATHRRRELTNELPSHCAGNPSLALNRASPSLSTDFASVFGTLLALKENESVNADMLFAHKPWSLAIVARRASLQVNTNVWTKTGYL